VQQAEIRLLFDYDRWAMRRVLNTAVRIEPSVWARGSVIGERGPGGILVHALGAHARWQNAWQGRSDKPRPELEPLPSPDDLRDRWEAEWGALDDFLEGLHDGRLNAVWDGLPLWQTMVHVVNHGTQHRSETAVLLTEAGRSPGDLDFIEFVEERSNSA
jgi:uncharacterized damage-inducible protein DinB